MFLYVITVKSFYGSRAVRTTLHPWKTVSVLAPNPDISSDECLFSDEDKDVRKGIANINTNNIVYESTESSYETSSKYSDYDHAHATTMTTTSAGKTSSKEKKQSFISDWLLRHLTKYQTEMQFVTTQSQTAM